MIVFSNEKNDLNSSKFQFKEPNLNYTHQSIIYYCSQFSVEEEYILF